MKANRNFGILKAIAFITAVFFFISCNPEEPLIKASITLGAPEKVTATSATIVALVTPNQDNTTVSFKYQADNSAWVTTTLPSKFSGIDPIKVTLDLSDLKPGTRYIFRVLASNIAGIDSSDVSIFFTVSLRDAVVKIEPAENVKISTASLSASVVPNQDNTTVSFEYQTANSTWKSQTLPTSFSGTALLKVKFDLSDLQANTKYNFRVKASNKAGVVLSDIISFRTYAVADYDGNLYHTVTIGSQTWLQENLRTTHYANGDLIAHVTDLKEWSKLSTGAYCYYNNDSSYAKVYGALYNWYVGVDPRGLIVGWYTPTIYEFIDLENYLGRDNFSGRAVTDNSGLYWHSTWEYWNPNNSSGLSLMPNGGIGEGGFFEELHTGCWLWSSSFSTTFKDAAVPMNLESSHLLIWASSIYSAKNGYGLRLLKN